uniref:Kinesin-like protein n=1 Tax=Haemonchus placei TaxID=6290 RepID=A0A0N4WQE9_HAEPC
LISFRRCATPGRNQYRERSLEDQDAVEVVCRLTPYYGPTPCLAVAEENIIRCIPPPTLQKRDGTPYQSKDFEFGYVFDESDRQQVVFERCAVDLIEHLLKGKNGLLFTYGVTGSGKTYTMTGKPTPEETGLLPRTLDVVFNSIDNKVDRCVFYPNGRNGFGIRPKMEATLARRQAEIERLQVSSEIEQRYMERLVPGYNDNYVCSVFVSYVEIYNNYCYDLLETKNTLTKRDTRLDINNMVYVDGAREVEVDNSDEALELFCKGEERRRTSDTILNKESSRSHSVFTIRLVMAPFDSTSYSVYPDSDPNRIVVSQLSLVDLAGSERAKRTQNVGDRLAEAASINKSLMVLRQCIEKLRRNQRSALHETVPYRDAKLTMLFKNFFEGAGKVRMIICANPKPSDFEENLNVLAFAEESQSVRVAQTDSGPRPPVPRRFFSRWNMEVDNIVTPASLLPSSTRLFTDFAIKVRFSDKTSESLRLYKAQFQRELLSLRERLSRYEVQDEEIITAEENLRRSVKEERSRARKQDQKLKVVNICDAPSPSFAQIRSKFVMAAETPSYATITPQKVSIVSKIFISSFIFRSKSAPRVLDHQPTNRVPTGGILRVKVPNNAKHVTKPEAHQLQKSSDYILTHQEVDREGNISTSVVKVSISNSIIFVFSHSCTLHV